MNKSQKRAERRYLIAGCLNGGFTSQHEIKYLVRNWEVLDFDVTLAIYSRFGDYLS